MIAFWKNSDAFLSVGSCSALNKIRSSGFYCILSRYKINATQTKRFLPQTKDPSKFLAAYQRRLSSGSWWIIGHAANSGFLDATAGYYFTRRGLPLGEAPLPAFCGFVAPTKAIFTNTAIH